MVVFIFALLSLATLVELIFSAVFLQLYLQRRRSIYLYFAIFTGIAIFWSLGTAIMLFARTTPLVFAGYWMFLIAPMLSTLFILFFCQQFIKGKINIWYVLGVIGVIVGAIFLAVNNDLLTITFASGGLNELHPNSIFYIFYGLYFIAYFDISIFVLRQHSKEKDLTKFHQAKNIVYGTGLTGTLGIFTNIFLPAIGVTQFVWMGPIFSLIFLAFSGIAITRYKLLDIKATILRSTSYIFTTIIMVAIFSAAISIGFGTAVLRNNISVSQWIIVAIATALIATTFAPLQRFFNRLSSRLFYRDAYDSQDLLSNLNNVLIGTLDLDSLLRQSADVINSAIKADYCVFGIKEVSNSPRRIIGTAHRDFTDEDITAVRTLTPNTKTKTIITDQLEESDSKLLPLLRKNDIGMIVRLTDTPSQAVEGLGYIVLGTKKNGTPYSSQDIAVLEIIADELVIAIQNALRFEEIQQFNITLQEKVDDATKKLRNANEKLIAMDQTKDDFISMASHQLRTPLTSVKGYVSMVLEGDVGKITKEQRKLLDQAFLSSQRMVYLIADLLNVSRLKTGKFIIEAKPTNLADVVEGELEQLKETAAARELELKYDKPKDFPVLNLDETKIRQVIMNFADNAIYYTPPGGHICVCLEDKGETIEFTVVDDGIGVPKSEQHNLFTKFYRAGNAKKARPDGTGLGLFMAKKVVIAQGGSIIFKTAEGKGSTFGFSFEKKKLATATAPQASSNPEAKPEPKPAAKA